MSVWITSLLGEPETKLNVSSSHIRSTSSIRKQSCPQDHLDNVHFNTASHQLWHSNRHSSSNVRLLRSYLPTFIQTQNQLCQPSEDLPEGLFLLVQVHSHPSHKERRDAIRATWGSVVKKFDNYLHIGLVFLLGLSPTSEETNQSVMKEGRLYRDIVQANFSDTYRNLTVKSIVGLEWNNEYCCNTKCTLKTDDDVYFNMTYLVRILQNYPISQKVLLSFNIHIYFLQVYPTVI